MSTVTTAATGGRKLPKIQSEKFAGDKKNRDGRGSETWKEGRTEEFDAKGKDQILVGKGLRKTYDGERYQFKAGAYTRSLFSST